MLKVGHVVEMLKVGHVVRKMLKVGHVVVLLFSMSGGWSCSSFVVKKC